VGWYTEAPCLCESVRCDKGLGKRRVVRGEADEAVVVVGADTNETRADVGGRSATTCDQRKRMNGWLAGLARAAHGCGLGWVLQLGAPFR
jgi:hypothetical protein